MHGSVCRMHVTNLSVCNWHHGRIPTSAVLNEQCVVMSFEKATLIGHLSLLISGILFNQFDAVRFLLWYHYVDLSACEELRMVQPSALHPFFLEVVSMF